MSSNISKTMTNRSSTNNYSIINYGTHDSVYNNDKDKNSNSNRKFSQLKRTDNYYRYGQTYIFSQYLGFGIDFRDS